MDKEKKELETLHGFNNIYELLSLFSSSLPLTMELMKVFEKEMAILEE